jgi:hypothetical protein
LSSFFKFYFRKAARNLDANLESDDGMFLCRKGISDDFFMLCRHAGFSVTRASHEERPR